MKLTRGKQRKEVLIELVKKLQPCTAFDIMRHVQEDDGFGDAMEKFRFIQSAHSGLHDLWMEGILDRPYKQVEEDSGEDVHTYVIAAPGTQPRKQSNKAYKQKYEAALEKIKELEEQVEFLIMMNEKLREKVAA